MGAALTRCSSLLRALSLLPRLQILQASSASPDRERMPITLRLTACPAISVWRRLLWWGSREREERRLSVHLEERAAWSQWMHCRSFASKPHRFRQNLGALQADRSFSRRAREQTSSTAESSTIFVTRLWTQTTGSPTTRENRARRSITMTLEPSSADPSDRTGHSFFCLTKGLVWTSRRPGSWTYLLHMPGPSLLPNSLLTSMLTLSPTTKMPAPAL